MLRIPSFRVPTHPGEILLEEFLKPNLLTPRELANGIHVPLKNVNQILNGRERITLTTAAHLAKFFGTTADFWINLQARWDLYHSQKEE